MNKPSFASRASKISSVTLSKEQNKVAEYCIIRSSVLFHEYLQYLLNGKENKNDNR